MKRRRREMALSARAQRDRACFAAGLHAAASFHGGRASMTARRAEHLRANPEVVPADLFHGMVADMEESAQQDHCDASFIMAMPMPASAPAAMRRADAEMRARYQKQIDELTEQRNRSQRREERLREALVASAPYLDALMRCVEDRDACLREVGADRVADYLRWHFWTPLDESPGRRDARVWLRHGVTVRLPAPGLETAAHAETLWAVAQAAGADEGRNPLKVVAAWMVPGQEKAAASCRLPRPVEASS